MEQIRNAFETISNWWFDLHYTPNQKRGLLSVGAGNPYGHPAAETIASLTRLGTQVFRTDQDGAIAITAQSHHLRVRKSKSAIGLFYWS